MIESRVVECRGRYVVVDIDDVRVQCTVPNTEGGRYCVNGYGDKSIADAAAYARSFGTSYRTRAEAEAIVSEEAEYTND
jgi:hypothetical protein